MRAILFSILVTTSVFVFGQSDSFRYAYTPDVPYLALCSGQTLYSLEQEHPGLAAAFAAAHPDVPLNQVQAGVPYELPVGWQTIDCPGLILAPNAIVRIRTLKAWDEIGTEMARISSTKMTNGPSGQMSYFQGYDGSYYQTRLQPQPVSSATADYWRWEHGVQHIVQPGESLIRIRNQHDCPVGWEAICDSAILFENGLKPGHIFQPGEQLFIPPLAPYANSIEGVVKIPVNRGMTLWSLRLWVEASYGEFAEASLLYSPQVYVNSRGEYEWRDISTRQVITVYLSWGALQKHDPRLYSVILNGWRN